MYINDRLLVSQFLKIRLCENDYEIYDKQLISKTEISYFKIKLDN